MKYTLSEKKILVIVGILFLSVPLVLLGQATWLTTKPIANAWSIAFPDPESQSFSFTVTNPGSTEAFSWSVLNKKKEILHGVTTVDRQTAVTVPIPEAVTDSLPKKILIQVKDSEGNVRELFRVLR